MLLIFVSADMVATVSMEHRVSYRWKLCLQDGSKADHFKSS